MPPVAAGAVALAAVLDLGLGEPPRRVHPVAFLGALVAPFDRDWAHPVTVGGLVALAVPAVAAIVAGGLTLAAVGVHPIAGGTVAGLVLFAATSRRMLLEAARDVVAGSETDLPAARSDLRALAGRDASSLSAEHVRSAAVESAAENFADGLVGPLLAFALLAPVSLPLAAAGAAWVKAVNTIDSMLGYPEKPVGAVGARLDDVVMWVPARLAALLIAVAARRPGALAAGRRWSGRPASPNSGAPMATLASALDVRLEKPGAYVLNPSAPLPSVERANRGADVVGLASGLAFVGAGVVAWL
jgi:adenosylcobinamide-phosphate synthase